MEFNEMTHELPYTSPESRKLFLLVHALPLTVTWLLIVPIAIYTSLFRRYPNRNYWFPLHVILLLLSFLVTIWAGGVGYVNSEGKHFNNVHRKFGGATVFLCIVQILLGFYISATWDAERTSSPWRDRIHWWLGRVTVFSAYVAILSGLFFRNFPSWIISVILVLEMGCVIFYTVHILNRPVENGYHVIQKNDGVSEEFGDTYLYTTTTE